MSRLVGESSAYSVARSSPGRSPHTGQLLPRLFGRCGFAAAPPVMSAAQQLAAAEGLRSHRKHLSSQFKGLLPDAHP